jgi:hypothetical protein
MKKLWRSLDKFYLTNCIFVSAIFLSIIAMFLVQITVENLQDEITKTDGEISVYQDQIQLLEVQWVYLTRPERLRNLSSLYLKNNGYALASQVKDEEKLEKFYFTKYQVNHNENLKAEAKINSNKI